MSETNLHTLRNRQSNTSWGVEQINEDHKHALREHRKRFNTKEYEEYQVKILNELLEKYGKPETKDELEEFQREFDNRMNDILDNSFFWKS